MIFDKELLMTRPLRNSFQLHKVNFIHNQIFKVIKKDIDLNSSCTKNNLFIGCDPHIYQIHPPAQHTTIVCNLAKNLLPKPQKTPEHSMLYLCCDNQQLPFRPDMFNFILHTSLHHTDNLQKALQSTYDILQNEGSLQAILPGDNNLPELRQAVHNLYNQTKKAYPIFPPTYTAANICTMALKAGYKNTVIKRHTITINYQHPVDLLYDLRQMGEGNILKRRQKGIVCGLYTKRILELYPQQQDKKYSATLEIFKLSANK